jgi:ABC-type sugar transport system ATPase subunit
MKPPADNIKIRGLRKNYGSTKALDGLDLDLRPGEVLGIAGPNGAGKSTLVRILAGEEPVDAGELLIGGRSFTLGATVAVVHQEPELFPNLTVAQNLRVGRERNRVLSPRADDADWELMEAMGISTFAGRLLGDCTLAVQQRTEIARALARDAQVFLFDEPNSALTKEESDELFREMHSLTAKGHIVVLVTHRLDDLVTHSRRVAIIRDGRVTVMLEGATLTEEAVAQHLVLVSDVERESRVHRLASAQAAAGTLVEVRDWSHAAGAFSGIDFDVAEGEIVAVMGVEGSGARELLRSFAGLAPSRGRIRVGDLTGASAIGVTSFVPASRQHSLYSNLSVGGNLVARFGREIAGFAGRLRAARMRMLAEDAIRHFLVRARNIGQPIRTLSGGNQQKVAIAQALARVPRLVLLEEPTRGVDIGSRREIYRLLRNYTDTSRACVLFCTEVLEIFETADRVHVITRGRISRPLEVADCSNVEALATEITRLEGEIRQSIIEPTM